ncbi:HAMP domain-containing sensor histidine kinase [Sphingobacterium bambusae]|uniref:histidine kinase n=1 Tax=Sphingobacterium bambusae TaxID=662858 RepID=A0ABW6BB65_9SPHI|nr:HAMP domain-containing sensor histidine kinase [Sphingobacterium bambusae]WPL48861.1 HAMP domain-containing sensor histidine kinase [Sphingobacterium bambusae]
MQIRTKLTILFTLITAAIVLAFAFVIYYSAKESREKEFYALLQKEAYTKANVFLNAKVNKTTLQEIYHNNRRLLNEVEVAIYDSRFNLIYHDAVDIDFVKETKIMLDEVLNKGNIGFYQNGWQVVGLVYNYQGKDYIVTGAAYDQYGYNKLDNLLKTIAVVFVVSMLVLYLTGRFFSRKAFDPIKQMTDRANDISATNLDLRLQNSGSRDELSKLAATFNEMLERLENSFDAQKHFVSNISHELRTPLAAIIAELELSAERDRTLPEYKDAILKALGDAKRIDRLSNSLLDLAKASYDFSKIAFKPLRIDEVLLDARQQVQKVNLDYRIDINFDEDIEHDGELLVLGNEYLLKVAFVNLLENGCKFSVEKQCAVSISFAHRKILLRFTDKGIGIPPADLDKVFMPFYRGENGMFADGNGIGLPLTQKIITLHRGTISVVSQKNQGTTFFIELATL